MMWILNLNWEWFEEIKNNNNNNELKVDLELKSKSRKEYGPLILYNFQIGVVISVYVISCEVYRDIFIIEFVTCNLLLFNICFHI